MAYEGSRARRVLGLFLCMTAALTLAACGGGSSVRATNGTFKVGDPYQINGVWYYPADNPNYNETGIASWYGEQFHGRSTANGERFDMNLLSAAHPTLPMPTHVRVTNLENNRSITVRLNDRGPFANGRIIDLSREAARQLGFERQGTAPVRVQMLGRAPLNVASNEAQNILNGRASRRGRAAETSTVMAAAITPPGPSTSHTEPQLAPNRAVSVDPDRQSRTNVAPSSDPRLYVQVGAFGLEGNAVNMQSQIVRTGQVSNVLVQPAWVGGEQLFRVRVGPFTDVLEADDALRRVAGLGYHGARIIVD